MRVLPKEEMPERRCTQKDGEMKREAEVEEVYDNGRTKHNKIPKGVEKEHIRSSLHLCNVDEQCQLGVALHRALQIRV